MAKRKQLKLPTADKISPNRWRCRVTVAGKTTTVYGESEYEAQVKAVQALADAKKDATDRQSGDLTVEKAIQNYIDKSTPSLSPSSIYGYTKILNNNKRYTTLRNLSVNNLTHDIIQHEIDLMKDAKTSGRKGGYSQKTIVEAMSLMFTAIKDYKTFHLDDFKFPQARPRKPRFLEPSEITRLREVLRGDRYELFLNLAVWLGMRRSELLGLHWKSVDLDKKRLTVECALVESTSGKVYKWETKNETSYRTLELSDHLVSLFEAHAPADEREGTVFEPKMDAAYKHFWRLCEKHDLKFPGLHGLRHTNASLLLSLGVEVPVILERGGWATDRVMKAVYAHAFEERKQVAASKINDFMAGKLTITDTDD